MSHKNLTFDPFNSRRPIIIVLLCCFGLLFGACSDSSTGTTNGDGDNNNGNGNNGGNIIGTEPTFSNVQQILEQSCGGAGCHVGERTNGVRLDSYENVMESEGQQYGELVVQAGDGAGSPLVDKIQPDPEYGVRMPENGNYLTSERINQIREWIDNGAEDN